LPQQHFCLFLTRYVILGGIYLLRKTLLVTCLLITIMTLIFVGAVSAETALTDFNGHWAASTISRWIDQGLIKGYEDNTIRPDNPVSRAEFVSMVNRAWGISNDGYSSVFQDVARDKWCYSDIAAAYNLGYISGSSPEIFEPDSTITREQAAVMIARLLTLEANSQNNVLFEIADHEQLVDWSRPYVETVFAQGILNGYPDKTFRPTRSVTRAEAMIIIDQAVRNTGTIVVYGQAGTYGPESGSKTIDGNVIISNADITLQNTIINGNLLLPVGIGEGDVKLKNVSVKGNTIIKGGGPNSITLEDSSLPNLTISKDGVRIVAAGNTSVQVIRLASGAALVEIKTTGPGFETIEVSQEILPGATIWLEGDFSTLTVQANTTLELHGTIDELNISQNVDDAVVHLKATSRVVTLNIDGSARIDGEGMIEKANINSNNVVIESVPVTTVVAPGVTASVGGKELQEGTTTADPPKTEKSGSGDSGGGGSGDSDDNDDPPLGSVLLGEGANIEPYLTYTVADGQAKITGYSSNGPQYLSIPDTLGGYPVTSIGNFAFSQKNLKVLELPSTLTSIGTWAFERNQLTILDIPEGVTSIGQGAFADNQLQSIVLPSTLMSIGSSAFAGNQLTSLVIPEGITSIGNYAFDANKLQSVVLPSTLTSIGSGVFSRNQLTSLVIPEGITSIGQGAFDANNLQSIVLPSTLTSIGPSAFGRNKLASLVIPDKVESVGNFAFNTNKLQVIFFPSSVTSIGTWAFSDNPLHAAVIPASVTNIGGGAFTSQSNPADLTIYGVPDSTAQAYANNNGHTFLEMADLKILSVNVRGQGTVHAAVDGQSTIQPIAGKHLFEVGTQLQLTQTPLDRNWEFVKWEVDGNEVADSDITIDMDQDITVNAYFQRKEPVYLYGSVTPKVSLPVPLPNNWLEGYIDVMIDGRIIATKSFTNGEYGYGGDHIVIEWADIEDALKNGKEIRLKVNDSFAIHDPINLSEVSRGQIIRLDLKSDSFYTPERYFEYWVPSWGGSAQIDRYSSNGPKDVRIPKRLGGYPVTTIFIYHDATGRNPIGAFQGRGLTSVEIPDTVTRIEDNAFSWNNLKEVTIPASVTYVGRAAFWGNQGTNTATQKPEQFIIRGVRGSAAEAYAKSYGHTFIAIP
jgi:hypothetical protein